MICPNCKRDATYVVDSRNSRDPRGIKRRRECAYCHERFNTYEITQESWSKLQRAFKKQEDKKKLKNVTNSYLNENAKSHEDYLDHIVDMFNEHWRKKGEVVNV